MIIPTAYSGDVLLNKANFRDDLFIIVFYNFSVLSCLFYMPSIT